ncbi:tyrosine recombinase XerC [Deinococcus xinjiangensis]|uniref:Tyrosine recombinase XerC n=1 Tax=Deinococcus xinjiangensis TaxID=457454 RepID=A0ABP9VBT2_9DEIO
MNADDFQRATEQFLKGLKRSPATLRAYRADLNHLGRWLLEQQQKLDAPALEAYFAAHSWAASTQNRKQTAIERFCRWARQHGKLEFDPTLHLERPTVPPPHPRGLRREDVERIFAVIPVSQARDALLFRLVFETGLRISEALNIHLDDLDLSKGDEHLTVLGKGGSAGRCCSMTPNWWVRCGNICAHWSTSMGRCSRRKRTGVVARCGIRACRNAGSITQLRQV